MTKLLIPTQQVPNPTQMVLDPTVSKNILVRTLNFSKVQISTLSQYGGGVCEIQRDLSLTADIKSSMFILQRRCAAVGNTDSACIYCESWRTGKFILQ